MPAVAVTLAWPSAPVTAGEPVRVGGGARGRRGEGDADAGHRVAVGVLDHRPPAGWRSPVATVAVWPEPETTATDAAAPGVLVRLKLAGVVTPRPWPSRCSCRRSPLAVAVTLAVPVAPMVAGLPLRVADAPLAGGVKVTRPPATGSTELLAVTVTTSGAGKAVSTPADWPLPEVTAMVNPLDSKAPMSTTPLTMRA